MMENTFWEELLYVLLNLIAASRPAHIAAWLSNVAHPPVRIVLLVARWIRDFQVLNCQTRHIIHGDFEVHWNWSDFFSAFGGCGLAKIDLCDQAMLVATLEFFNCPLGNLFLWFVLESLTLDALRKLKRDSSRGAWDGELHDDLCSKVVLRELSTDLHCELESVAWYFIYERVDAEWGWILSVNSIVHHKELPVGRVYRNCLHCFKVSRVDTFMEVAVIQNDTTLLSHGRSAHSQVVVEHKTQFRVTNQIALHLNYSIYSCVDHNSIGVEQDLQ